MVVGIYLTAFGLALAAFPQSELMNLFINNQINPVFALGNDTSQGAMYFQAWIYGVLGATLASWGILITAIASFAFRPGEKWAWYSISVAITLWFVIDQIVSLYHSVLFNVAFNAILFAILVLPLLFTRKYFINSSH